MCFVDMYCTETSETMREDIKVVIMVASVVVGYEDRKNRNWYNEECEIKVDEKIQPKSKC
jgi:hypothetical protein